MTLFPPANSTRRRVPKDKLQPFQRSFPLELFEAIIQHADTQAIARTARASFVCYELFMPVLLDRIDDLNEVRIKALFEAPYEVSACVNAFS